MVLTIKLIIAVLAFSSVPIPLASEPIKVDVCSVKANISEAKYMEKQSNIPQWLTTRFDIILGFALGLFSASIIDYLRTRRKAKQFRHAACNELKQVLAELTIYAMHPDSEIDEEKVKLWWDSKSAFNLIEATLPAENNELYEKLKKLEMNHNNISAFIAVHNARREERRRQGKLMTLRKLNCRFISNNIEMLSILNVTEASRLTNILRRIDALNRSVAQIDFSFKKTFDSSLSSTNHDIIVTNYYSECRCLSNFAKITAKEVADLIIKWQ